jgi:catechol 2,3-dioxygenase-like lactoylglutathione lyase family enzyme
MRDYRDAKAMAQSLKKTLAAKSIDIGHSESLEMISKAFGLDNWNVLSAKINEDEPGDIRFLRTTPVLRIFDIDKAKEFYCDYLGFHWDWEHRFDDNAPVYAGISRGPLLFHLSQHFGDASPGAVVFIAMSGIDAFHRALDAKNYPFLRPGLEEYDWGRGVNLLDPFGNKLRFTELKSA